MAIELMQALQDFFVAEFDKGNPAATAAAGFVLAFEHFPITLTPEACLLDEADLSSYVQARQQEMITRLVVDHATLLSGAYRLSATEWLSDTYQHELLGPCRYHGDATADAAAEAEASAHFAILRSKAQAEFRTVVSVTGQPDDFAPTDALPSNWLDMRQEENWLSYAFSASSAPSPPSTAPGRMPRLAWRAVDAGLLASVVKAIDGDADPATPASDPPKAGGTRRLHLRGTVDLAAIHGATVAHQPAPVETRGAFDASRMATMRRLEGFGKGSQAKRGKGLAELLLKRPARRELSFNRELLAARADLADVLAENVVETSPAPANDKIEVSFRYQVVRVSRPWMFHPFLRHPRWFVPGMRAGELSDPGRPDAPGRMGLVPVALLVIRDLELTADWNERDLQELENSFALGPFGKGTKARFVGQVLKCDGVQVIGCINERLPLLPPRSDPALEAVT